jgi:hypothetical protein
MIEFFRRGWFTLANIFMKSATYFIDELNERPRGTNIVFVAARLSAPEFSNCKRRHGVLNKE